MNRAALTALADAADALARAVRALALESDAPAPADDLVRLSSLPFDVEARRRLVRGGDLPAVRIGRHLYTTRLAVLALATKLPPAKLPGPKATPQVDDLAEAARRRAARRATP